MSGTATPDRFMTTSTVAGRTVGFSAVAGEVVAVERWTETQVSTASGSVQVFGNTVAVSPPQVWATAVGRKAIWIRTASDELQIPVPENTQVRQGHRVHAVVSTGVDYGRSQWAAIVNHDTSRWMQVDVYPPSGFYDPFTGFVMAFGGSAGGAPGQAIMWLYVVVVCGLFVLVGRSWWSLVWGFPIGVVMACIQMVVGGFQAKSGMREYAAAVRAACDSVSASVREG